MLAVHAMSGGTQAILYFIALVAFVVAAVIAWLPSPQRNVWAVLIAIGLALFALVLFWNALALS